MGKLQAEVLGIVHSLGEASVREVCQEINKERKVAYTSVGTTLSRLYNKGFLWRRLKGVRGAYVYGPVQDESVERGLVKELIERMVRAFGPRIVSRISDGLDDVSTEEVQQISSEILRKRGDDDAND